MFDMTYKSHQPKQNGVREALEEKCRDGRFLDERAVSELFNISLKTVQRMRQTGQGPLFHKISSRAVRYDPGELLDYFDRSVRRSTLDSGDTR
jgi:predicted DNA-binding transcriptional regulator AlpA